MRLILLVIMRFLHLLRWQFKIHHQAQGLSFLLLMFQLMAVFMLPFIIGNANIAIKGSQLFILIIVLSSIIIMPLYLYSDHHDGSLAQLLTIHSALEILLSKICALYFINIIITLIVLPITTLLYDLDFARMSCLLLSAILTMVFAYVVALTSAIVKLYFANNNEYISLIMLPIMVPVLICSSLAIETASWFYFILLLAINLVVVPIIVTLNNYLLKNLYNI